MRIEQSGRHFLRKHYIVGLVALAVVLVAIFALVFFFIGLAELPRYIYWVQGRAIYTWIALLAIVVLLTRGSRGRQRETDERALVAGHS